MNTEFDRELEGAQAALLARFAPETRVRRIRWSQGETQVLELGTGAPLVLVHGGGDGAFEWVPILPALARTRRVIAVDRPGHGLADPFDYRGVDFLDHASTFLQDMLDALELPTADIAANSIGGLWSAAFALDKPQRVSRLALVGAPPGVTREAPLVLRLMSLRLVGAPLGRLMMRNPTRDGARKFWGQIQVAHPERIDDTLLDVDVAHMRRNLDTILSLLRCIGDGLRNRSLIVSNRLQTLEVPTVFLRGDRDVFITHKAEKAWEAIAAGNANVGVVRIPDAGHLPWFDEPERVVGEIEHFLSTEQPLGMAVAQSPPSSTSTATKATATA